MVLFNVNVFVGCVCFFVPLLLILLTHSLFLDFCLSIFRVVFLFGLCFFLILLVFLSSSCYCSKIFSLIVLAVAFVILIPLSHVLFLILLPHADLKKKTMERTSISFYLPLGPPGDLCENVLSKTLVSVVFFCGFLLSTKHVCLSLWNLFWGSKAFFVVFLLVVILLFGFWKAFFRSNFSLVPGFFGLVVFYVRALLIFVFLLVWCFGALVCLFSIIFVILGSSFLHCSVLMLLLLLHVLEGEGWDRRIMHRAWRCVVAQKGLLVFKTTQGCFWEECIGSEGVQIWRISKPQKSRGRLQGSFGGVWRKCPKSVKIRWCFRVAESGMKVAST